MPSVNRNGDLPGPAIEAPHRRQRTERAVLDDLTGQLTLAEVYAAVEAAGETVTDRDDGRTVIHGANDTRWKRRTRGALQTLARAGRARRVGDSLWLFDRPETDTPRRSVLVSLRGERARVELRLQAAADLLASLDEPADLIITDPPYGLGVGQGARVDTGARVYGRRDDLVVPGYVEAPAGRQYREFTAEWITAAAAALRDGGHLAVVTGPQQAAHVQVAAEDAGLTYVNQVVVGRVFALRTTRRFAHAHWTVTLMCRGPLTSRRRVFNPPPDLPPARSGVAYPLDLWPIGDVGRQDAPAGQPRYRNALPVRLVDRFVAALTRDPGGDRPNPDLVCDPFVGSGTTAVVTLARGLRLVAGDLNPHALDFTRARINARLQSAPRRTSPTLPLLSEQGVLECFDTAGR